MTIDVALKPALVWSLLLAVAGGRPAAPASRSSTAAPYGYRYARGVTVAPGVGQACAVLDAAMFAHAAASLADVALFEGGGSAAERGDEREQPEAHELPFATTLSEPLDVETDTARVLNRAVSQDGHLSFDLAMPARSYTEVVLDLDRRNYVAIARVWGETRPGERLTPLGHFTLFDLSAEHLFHVTGIPLTESSFPYLHIDLAFEQADSSAARALLRTMPVRVSAPPSREAQSLYTTTQETTAFTRRGQQMVASFRLPVHVPVERVAITLPAGYKSDFSRQIEISARADQDPASAATATTEKFSGTIFRVRRKTAQGNLSAEALSVPVAIGSNMQRAATLEVAIDDAAGSGDGYGGGTLPVASVALQMRQRRICFDAPRELQEPLTLAYGDTRFADGVMRPQRDRALLRLAATERVATLGPEMELDGRGNALAQMSSTPGTDSGGAAIAPHAGSQRVSLRLRAAQAIRVLTMLLLATLLAARFARRRRR